MSDSVARGIGIDFGAARCRVISIEETNRRLLCDDIVPPTLLMHVAATEAGTHNRVSRQSIKRYLGMSKTVESVAGLVDLDEKVVDFFKELKDKSENSLNGTITAAAVAIPPAFSERQNAALERCVRKAGFRSIRLVDDSRAAALALMSAGVERGKWLIYGLGKSAFFASVVDTTDGVRVMSHRLLDCGAGDEFDSLLLDWLLARNVFSTVDGMILDVRGLTRLLQFTEECKWILSSKESLTEAVLKWDGRSYPLRFTLRRDDFEMLISDHINQTIETAGEAIHDAGITPSDIVHVVFLGGSTTIPLVRKQLAALVPGKIVEVDDDTVARGAALYSTDIGECFSYKDSTSVSSIPASPLPSAGDFPAEMVDLWEQIRNKGSRVPCNETLYAYEQFIKAADLDLAYLYRQTAAILKEQGKIEDAIRVLKDFVTRKKSEREHSRSPAEVVVAEKLSDLYLVQAETVLSRAVGKDQKAAMKTAKKFLGMSLDHNKDNARARKLQIQVAQKLR